MFVFLYSVRAYGRLVPQNARFLSLNDLLRSSQEIELAMRVGASMPIPAFVGH